MPMRFLEVDMRYNGASKEPLPFSFRYKPSHICISPVDNALNCCYSLLLGKGDPIKLKKRDRVDKSEYRQIDGTRYLYTVPQPRI